MWLYPDGSRILELSTKAAPSEAFQVAAEARAYLSQVGVDLGGAQEPKTERRSSSTAKQRAGATTALTLGRKRRERGRSIASVSLRLTCQSLRSSVVQVAERGRAGRPCRHRRRVTLPFPSRWGRAARC